MGGSGAEFMKISIERVYYGPNPAAPRPVLIWRLEIGAEAGDLVARAWAGMRRLVGAWLSDVEEPPADPEVNLALLLSLSARGLLNATNGLIDDAGAARDASGAVRGWIGFQEPERTRRALELAARALLELRSGKPFPSAALLKDLDTFGSRVHPPRPDYISRILTIAARARHIPAAPSHAVPGVWRYGWGSASRLMLEACSDRDGLIGARIASRKSVTRLFLQRLGFPTVEHKPARTAQDAVALARQFAGPVVVKPGDRGKGKGITVGIETEADIRRAFDQARAFTDEPILVERFVPGADHRLLVVGGRLVAAARRDPASVTGDGTRTVRQLVDDLNRRRAADPVSARHLKQIAFDDILTAQLDRQTMHLDTVPAAGAAVTLRSTANVSTGGQPTDVLAAVHPQVRSMAEAVARNAGLHAVGIDYITTDIARPWQESGGAIVEINATPGLDVHIASGVNEEQIGALVLGDDVGRIPVAVVVAPPETQFRLVEALRRGAASWSGDWRWGFAWESGVSVGGLMLKPAAGPHLRIMQLLDNGDCDAALICVTARQIAEIGFPVDRADLTVLIEDEPAPIIAALAERCSVTLLRQAPGAWDVGAIVSRLSSVIGPPHTIPVTW
jgi:cyanophycin synthetase